MHQPLFLQHGDQRAGEIHPVGAVHGIFAIFHVDAPGTGNSIVDIAIAIVEPGMGLLPRFIMSLFHHEPLGFGQPIEWDAPDGFDPASHPYYAAQGNSWRAFVRKEGLQQHVLPDWKLVHVGREPGWAWLLCGGLRGPQLYPDSMLPVVRLLERVLRLLPSLFSGRLLVVLERKKNQA